MYNTYILNVYIVYRQWNIIFKHLYRKVNGHVNEEVQWLLYKVLHFANE